MLTKVWRNNKRKAPGNELYFRKPTNKWANTAHVDMLWLHATQMKRWRRYIS